MNFEYLVSKLPLKASNKLELYKDIRRIHWRFKYNSQQYNELVATQTLVPQNSYYGHEYWLRNYAAYDKSLKTLIEHGLFLKCEIDKIGWDVEWDLGSIFTFGDARYEVLSRMYPDYKLYRIGPRIHYVPIDKDYVNEIKKQIDLSKKTVVLFPTHSIFDYKNPYDVNLFIDDACSFAVNNSIGNILVCLHPSDYRYNYQYEYMNRNKKMILVSGGENPIKFLSRLKAILSISDIVYSNSFGTHIGYAIYMNKPLVINTRSDSLDTEKPEISNFSYSIKDYEQEKNLFIKEFSGSDPWKISNPQKELVDYYFGLSHVKNKEELYKCFEYCEDLYNKRFL